MGLRRLGGYDEACPRSARAERTYVALKRRRWWNGRASYGSYERLETM